MRAARAALATATQGTATALALTSEAATDSTPGLPSGSAHVECNCPDAAAFLPATFLPTGYAGHISTGATVVSAWQTTFGPSTVAARGTSLPATAAKAAAPALATASTVPASAATCAAGAIAAADTAIATRTCAIIAPVISALHRTAACTAQIATSATVPAIPVPDARAASGSALLCRRARRVDFRLA